MNNYRKINTVSPLVPFVFCLLITLNSCVKEPDPASQNPNVSSFTEIRTGPTFNWDATQSVTLEVAGLATPNVIKKTLRVTSLDGSAVYFSKLQTLSENLSTPFVMPTSVIRVKVVYGVIVKEVNIVNKTIKFDYLTVSE